MTLKQIVIGERFRQSVLRGVNLFTGAVKTRLVPKGRTLLNGIRESANKIHFRRIEGR